MYFKTKNAILKLYWCIPHPHITTNFRFKTMNFATYLSLSPISTLKPRYVVFWYIKNKWSCSGRNRLARFVQQFKSSCTNWHWYSHDDAFTYSSNLIFLTVVWCIEQMIWGSFELKKKGVIFRILTFLLFLPKPTLKLTLSF